MAVLPAFKIRMKELRNEKGITQYEMAEQLSFTRASVGHWEQGARVPNYKNLTKIADFFGVSVDYLLGNTDLQNQYEAVGYIIQRLRDEGFAQTGKPIQKDIIDQFIDGMKMINNFKNM